LSWAHFQGRWSKPGSWTGRLFPDLDIFKEAVSMAERGLFDLIFFGDNIGIPNIYRGRMDEAVKYGVGFPRHDMSSTIAALSQYSKHVGFGLTYSSTFMHPFYTARLLNGLDHITGGRIAFNVVASTRRGNAANFGMDQLMDHNSRYERMEEFISVCKKLWASVPADAFVWDRESGIVIDQPERIKAIDHVGEFFKVKGPLPCVPSPQGRPVLIQAGGSPRGIKASANFADYIFGAAKPAKGMAKHRADLDAALKAEGRDPGQVGILWGIIAMVGETEADAVRRKEMLLKLMPSEGIAALISDGAGWDFSTLPQRFKLKDVNDEIAATNASPVGIVYTLMQQFGDDAEMTREEFFEHAMLKASGYDRALAGTASQVADQLEATFEETGSRGGFMIGHPPSMPRDLLNVVDFLIPELQRRGRFRTKYESTLLKENLAIAA
jgi:FMN-dependent oxidoreductase (nitrilotriacetate monooxygenase family)